MKIGYARVSTDDQNLDLQMDALNKAGCEKIFTDHGVSGIADNRPGLFQAIAAVRGRTNTRVTRCLAPRCSGAG